MKSSLSAALLLAAVSLAACGGGTSAGPKQPVTQTGITAGTIPLGATQAGSATQVGGLPDGGTQTTAATPGRVAGALPEGCNLGVEQQTIGAVVDQSAVFQFDGYNVVPPGHRVTGVSISWGDGPTSRGSATLNTKSFAPGCYQTVFAGRHDYTLVPCTSGACNRVYDVAVHFTDAETRAPQTLTKFSVDVIRLAKH
jgi:hypothetical protein